MQSSLESNSARRFVLHLLKSTRKKSNVSLDLISTYASCSRELSAKLVAELGIPVIDGSLQLSRNLRLDLAMAEANRGFLHEASRYLEWQDFERFAERCLSQ